MVDALASDRSDEPFAKPFCQGEPGAMGLSRMLCVPKILLSGNARPGPREGSEPGALMLSPLCVRVAACQG